MNLAMQTPTQLRPGMGASGAPTLAHHVPAASQAGTTRAQPRPGGGLRSLFSIWWARSRFRLWNAASSALRWPARPWLWLATRAADRAASAFYDWGLKTEPRCHACRRWLH